MFEVVNRRTKSRTILQLLELIFTWSVREVSRGHRNAALRILTQLGQLVIMIVAFSLMMNVFGMRKSSPIRGDSLLFLTSGILLFMLFNQTVSSIFGAEKPNDPIMQHAPMNTFVAMAARAISTLYVQVMLVTLVAGGYYLYNGSIELQHPLGALKYLICCWWIAVCTGIFLRSVAIFLPRFAAIFQMAYMRANMIFSGKMTPANYLTPAIMPMFAWNPLFHVIDAFRGQIFINYTSHKTDVTYAMTVATILLMLGMLGDFYGRQRMRGKQHG